MCHCFATDTIICSDDTMDELINTITSVEQFVYSKQVKDEGYQRQCILW